MDVPEIESKVEVRDIGVLVPLAGALEAGREAYVEIGEEWELVEGVVGSSIPSSGVVSWLNPLRLEAVLLLVLDRPPPLAGLGMYFAVQLRFLWVMSGVLI